MDPDSDTGWSQSSFGHGMFQQMIMKPIIQQHAGSCSSILLADQTVIVGVLLSKPEGYKGKNSDFHKCVEKAIHRIEFGFSVLHDGSDVLHETFYMAALKQNEENLPERSLRVTDAGVSITFHTTLNIAKQYLNIPLQILVTMNIMQTQVKPFNQRLIMDKTEMNVRLLMDLNRYRPQKIPERSLVVPIQIMHPLCVDCHEREISSDLTVLSVTIRNVHDTASVLIHELVFHTERMLHLPIVRDSEVTLDVHTLSGLFDISLLNAKDYDENALVIVPPHEEYTFLYSIKLKTATNCDSDPAHRFIFTTPCTLFWSIAACDDTEKATISLAHAHAHAHAHVSNGEQTEIRAVVRELAAGRHAYPSELDIIVAWTLGSKYSPSITSTSMSHNSTSLVPSYTNTSMINKSSGLEITLRGPGVAYLSNRFELRVCLTNFSTNTVENPVLYVRSRWVCFCLCMLLCFILLVCEFMLM